MERRKLVRDRLTYPIQGISVILALIYLSPFVSSLLNYAAFLMCMYRLVKYDERVFSVDYCCLISVATVFALPGGFSLVVVLSLLAEFWFVVRDGAVLDSAMAVLFLLVCYLMLRIQSSVSGFVLCISQLLIFHRMLSFADTQTILLDIGAFVLSVLTSSVYALVFRKTSAMTAIVGREVLAYYGSSLTRFQGLFRDPNYYMSLVIMAIVLLTLLYFKKYISKALFSAGIVCMFFFGALTYSKTFLFLICLYWGLCFFYLLRAGRYIFAAAFSVGTVVLAIILSNTLFATTLYRITSASSVSELTTGRTDMFEEYWREIISSPGTMLFGKGLSAQLLKKGTHNLFLEIQYYVGVIGLTLYLFYFGALVVRMQKKSAAGCYPSRLFSNSPLIVFIVLFSSLQGMFSISVYTLLYLAVIAIAVPQKDCLQGKRAVK